MLDPQPHDQEIANRVAITACAYPYSSRSRSIFHPIDKAVSLAVMLVEFLLLVRDEIKFVWP